MATLQALNDLAESERARGHLEKAVDCALRCMEGLRGGDFPASPQADARINLGRSRLLAGAPVAEVHPVFVEAFNWAARDRASMIVSRTLDCLAETVGPPIPRTRPGFSAPPQQYAGPTGFPARMGPVVSRRPIADGRESDRPRANDALVGSVKDLSLDQALQLGREITETT